MYNLFSSSKDGEDVAVVYSLGNQCTIHVADTKSLSPQDPHYKLVLLSQSIESILIEEVACTLQRV